MSDRGMKSWRARQHPSAHDPSNDNVVRRVTLMRRILSVCTPIGFFLMLSAWIPWSPADAAAPGTPTPPASPSTDEAEMVYIPAGEFTMGHDGDYDTKPVKRINLPAFYIDKYEVTNKRYKRFIDATGYKVPWSQDPAAAPFIWDWQKRMYPEGKGDDPVVLVSWEAAKAFAAWAGKSLPSEAQWEKAARGANGNIYPWGTTWADGKANTSESHVRQTAPVGMFKEDVSPYGVYDMGGNVSEWVEEWFAPYPGNPLLSYVEREKYKVLRGGSWDYAHSIATGHHRQYATPQSQMTAIGFRCVKAADESSGAPPKEQTR
jgi:formylglycine-generating enzyme required for sulfatase activity